MLSFKQAFLPMSVIKITKRAMVTLGLVLRELFV